MPLQDLNIDVLLHTFGFADVSTILSLSRVNKSFHAISKTKQLWIRIVRRLGTEGVLDAPPDDNLKEMSTKALVDEVKRAVLGPHTWSPASSDPPTVLRQFTVPVQSNDPRCQLLPGGRYLVVHIFSSSFGYVECWDCHIGRKVWSSNSLNCSIDHAVFDLRPRSTAVAALLCAHRDDTNCKPLIIMELDLATGESKELGRLSVPFNLNGYTIQISGDIMACNATPFGGTCPAGVILLVNWVTGEYIIFQSDRFAAMHNVVAIALFPSHFILAYHENTAESYEEPPSYSVEMNLCTLASLVGHWRPLGEGSCIHVLRLSSRCLLDLQLSTRVYISAARTPLHDQELCVDWEMDRNLKGDYVFETMTSRYLLGLSSPLSSLKFLRRHSRTLHFGTIPQTSLAGYSVTLAHQGGGIRVYHPDDVDQGPAPREVPLPNLRQPDRVQLSASGAVLAFYPGHVDILHYM
ncbi:hypothetical protein C8R43DRAFT_1243559 [Mycena crocata]|nr:hypothetical protein C8R43DRAFT_1243559 [Mycena crocata]